MQPSEQGWDKISGSTVSVRKGYDFSNRGRGFGPINRWNKTIEQTCTG